MNSTVQNEIFAHLYGEFHKLNLNVSRISGASGNQLGDTMRVLIAVTQAAKPAVMDLTVANLSEEQSILQIYITLADAVRAPAELDKALRAVNFFCPVGSFGMYEQQLYHKYALVLDENLTPELMAFDAINAIAAVYTVLDYYGTVVSAIASGSKTLAQAFEAGILPPYRP